MQRAVQGLKPEALWKYFSEISDIPRESGNEEGVRQYLLAFAKEHGLEAISDAIGNIIIRKGASKGFEGRPSVALQGHMDMVCVKVEGSTHDFAKDPIKLVRDGAFLKADGTTLGGDNGIALAMILDILSDTNAQHGPLEAIFTISEETGLNGAFALEKENIKSRLMLNLDSEEEGVIYIGCAGGIEMRAFLPVVWNTPPSDAKAFQLTANGMLGGHSGGEIHKQRSNAIKAVARVLHHAPDFSVFSAQGGTKRNVIPSVCNVGFVVAKHQEQILRTLVEKTEADLRGEFEVSDPDLKLTLREVELPKKVVDAATSRTIFTALYAAPHGVEAMSTSIPGIVETSSNLAIFSLEEDGYHIVSSHRSSIQSARDDIASRMAALFSLAGATCTLENAYPSWKPNPHSALAGFCFRAYEEYTGKKPTITAIHAGLECGIINSKVPGMDSVSIGPDMFDVHSVKERLDIGSVERISGFVRHLLSIIE